MPLGNKDPEFQIVMQIPCLAHIHRTTAGYIATSVDFSEGIKEEQANGMESEGRSGEAVTFSSSKDKIRKFLWAAQETKM